MTRHAFYSFSRLPTLGRLVLIVVLAGCSKTPKEQALAGFDSSCNAISDAQVERFCSCMHSGLDKAIPARQFNDPEADQGALMDAFAAQAAQLQPVCKRESQGTGSGGFLSGE